MSTKISSKHEILTTIHNLVIVNIDWKAKIDPVDIHMRELKM